MERFARSISIIKVMLFAMAICALSLSGCATAPAPSGALTIASGTYDVNGAAHPVDVGTLVVPENRNDPASRQIKIPVTRLLSNSKNPVAPVFLLTGGPGDSNIWKNPPLWLLDHHVMVGYRGVDSSVSLATPEYTAVLKCLVSLTSLTNEDLRNMDKAVFNDLRKLEEQGRLGNCKGEII